MSGVPWRQAGPGWSVAEYSAASLPGAAKHPVKGRTTFYLVSPKGRKYAFYRTPDAAAYPQFDLIDWSGDRHRILVQRVTSGNVQHVVFEQISLATGAVVSRFSLPADVDPVEYTRPHGDSILALGFGSRSGGILRYDLTGHLQRVLAPGVFQSEGTHLPDQVSGLNSGAFGGSW